MFLPPATPFDEYDAWASQASERKSIENGQRIFNQRRLLIANVAGLNDALPPSLPSPFPGTCSTCHNVDNAGADLIANPQRDLGIGGTVAVLGGGPPQVTSRSFASPAAPMPCPTRFSAVGRSRPTIRAWRG